jgi:hypothetical protein
MTASSTEGIKTVLHPVSDLARAKPGCGGAHLLRLLRVCGFPPLDQA